MEGSINYNMSLTTVDHLKLTKSFFSRIICLDTRILFIRDLNKAFNAVSLQKIFAESGEDRC